MMRDKQMTNSKQQTRRDFFKLAGGTAAVAGMAATGSLAFSGAAAAADCAKPDFSGKQLKFKGPKQAVNVFSEDGVLREALFGRTVFTLPAYAPIWDFAGKRMTDLMKKFPGKTFEEADPEWFKAVDTQRTRVVDFLESRGIVVHRPAPLSEQMTKSFQAMSQMNVDGFGRDGQVSVGNRLFETAFMTPERMRNKYTYRYVTMELMRNGTEIMSTPQPLDTYDHDYDLEPLIEGGDVLVDHGHLYIGNSGMATNSLGIQWAKNAFPEWDVHEIKIKTNQFPHQHLDGLMVAFGDWGVVYEDDIVGGIAGLPEPLRKKQWIKMKLEEAEDKRGNFFAISPTDLVMMTEAKRLREAIKAARPEITIHHFPYAEVAAMGGGLRCSTQPIFREG
jgi:N-dimethylarginine dimethylaminohydrolase